MNTSYKMYCLGNVLLDKGYSYINSKSNEDKKAKRMNNIDRGAMGAL